MFRRKAVGRMPAYDTVSDRLVFPQRQNARLQVSVTSIDATGECFLSRNTFNKIDDSTLDGALKAAQQEVVEQEIFSLLVQEAGSLPTASARVAERLIVIDAAQGTELKFELVSLILRNNIHSADIYVSSIPTPFFHSVSNWRHAMKSVT